MANDNTFAGANQAQFVDGAYTAQDRIGGRDDATSSCSGSKPARP